MELNGEIAVRNRIDVGKVLKDFEPQNSPGFFEGRWSGGILVKNCLQAKKSILCLVLIRLAIRIAFLSVVYGKVRMRSLLGHNAVDLLVLFGVVEKGLVLVGGILVQNMQWLRHRPNKPCPSRIV